MTISYNTYHTFAGNGDIISHRDMNEISFNPKKRIIAPPTTEDMTPIMTMKYATEKMYAEPIDSSIFFNMSSDAPVNRRKCDPSQEYMRSTVFSRAAAAEAKKQRYMLGRRNQSESDLLHFDVTNTSVPPTAYKLKKPFVHSPNTLEKKEERPMHLDSRFCKGTYRVDWGYDNI